MVESFFMRKINICVKKKRNNITYEILSGFIPTLNGEIISGSLV